MNVSLNFDQNTSFAFAVAARFDLALPGQGKEVRRVGATMTWSGKGQLS